MSGDWCPRIYLPCGLNEAEQGYVLAHERTHIRRGDLWWKALGTAALALHWWNPLVWLAYRAFTWDMELSCDEAVLRRLGGGNEQDYSRTLLALAANRKDFGPALAFGKPAVKERIQNALRFRRAGRSVLAVSLALLLIAGLCCCTGAVAGDASAESGLREKAERLCALQVSYIGDNSAVSALVDEVVGQPYQLTLQTTEIPYGLVVELTGNTELSEDTAFLWGAELLALIDNADYCSFQVSGQAAQYRLERTAAETALGMDDLRDACQSADDMASFLSKLDGTADAGEAVTCTDAGGDETVYATFDDLMGYSGEIVLNVSADSFKTLYYYGATESGGTILLGESFGWYTEDEIVDLDGDGVTELVCNVTYGGDGAERCYVYSLGEDGQSVQWSINTDAFLDADTIWSVNATTERYADGVFTLTALPVKDGEDLPEETYHPAWPEDFVQTAWP